MEKVQTYILYNKLSFEIHAVNLIWCHCCFILDKLKGTHNLWTINPLTALRRSLKYIWWTHAEVLSGFKGSSEALTQIMRPHKWNTLFIHRLLYSVLSIDCIKTGVEVAVTKVQKKRDPITKRHRSVWIEDLRKLSWDKILVINQVDTAIIPSFLICHPCFLFHKMALNNNNWQIQPVLELHFFSTVYNSPLSMNCKIHTFTNTVDEPSWKLCS